MGVALVSDNSPEQARAQREERSRVAEAEFQAAATRATDEMNEAIKQSEERRLQDIRDADFVPIAAIRAAEDHRVRVQIACATQRQIIHDAEDRKFQITGRPRRTDPLGF